MDYPVPRSFRNLTLQTYPSLAASVNLRRLMCRMLFSSRLAEEDGGVLVDYFALATDAGKLSQARSNNFEAEKFLHQFREAVGGDASFSWSDFDHERGQCRTAKLKLRPKVAEALASLFAASVSRGDDLIFFVSGRRATKRNRREELKNARKQAASLAANAECPEAQEIINYLNNVRSTHFEGVSKVAADTIIAAKDSHVLQKLNQVSRACQMRSLRNIVSCPVPIYGPSAKGRTSRVFSDGEGLANLKRELRHQVCSGWYEADLKNAQLAIVARLWDVQEVQAFLQAGRKLWDELLLLLGVDEVDPRRPEVKDACKQALYSLVFGMALPSVRAELTKRLRPIGIEPSTDIFAHEVLAALAFRRKAVMQDLINAGEALTCFGKRIAVMDEVDARSALAQQAQAVELRIIHAAYVLAQQTNEFHIVLHQHDGISIAFMRRPELWMKRISDAVESRAREMGIVTTLEWKAL